MKERKEKEIEKKEKKAKKWSGEKKFYLFTALGCAAALTAIVIVAVAVTGGGKVEDNQASGGSNIENEQPDDPSNEQVSGLPEGMISPVEAGKLANEYGFYHNETLNCYYVHKGVDFAAEAGTSVLAVEDGTVESIYKGDLLVGTEIVINHGDGLKSVYRFVTEAEGLQVGDTVEKGEIIATVAEASGNEYKEGAHLHFEIVKNDALVDPSVYLTLDEK